MIFDATSIDDVNASERTMITMTRASESERTVSFDTNSRIEGILR